MECADDLSYSRRSSLWQGSKRVAIEIDDIVWEPKLAPKICKRVNLIELLAIIEGNIRMRR